MTRKKGRREEWKKFRDSSFPWLTREEINNRQPGADAQTPHGGDLTSTSDTFTTRDSIGPRINEGARWLGELREDDANRTM